jgi:hypothetical protein
LRCFRPFAARLKQRQNPAPGNAADDSADEANDDRYGKRSVARNLNIGTIEKFPQRSLPLLSSHWF